MSIAVPSTDHHASLTTSWSLGLNHSVTVRPISPDDADIVRASAHGLSRESRYNRFLGGGFALTPEWMDRLVRIDFSRDMALIATVALDGEDTQIGVSRYVRLGERTSCELAVTVADAWQGRGIGRRLLARLVDVARGAGIRRMFGEVLANNARMLHLASSLGFRVGLHPDGGALRRVSLDLN